MLFPASGTGKFFSRSAKIIRFARFGCTNRPFFHIVVTERRRDQYQPVIEQLGTFDPIVNQYDEKLVSLNVERIRHWLGRGAHISPPVAELLGLSGLLPVHPKSYMTAWRNRRSEEQKKNEEKPQETNDSPT